MLRRFGRENLLGILLLAAFFILSTRGVRQVVAVQKQEGEIIVIDAGHGGEDPGKVGVDGILEKEINLAISKKLKRCLEKENRRVIMTREDENGLYEEGSDHKKLEDMRKRCEKIDAANPQLTVSIHQNSYTQESVCGPQVFYFTHSSEAEKIANAIQEALNEELKIERPRQCKANDTYYLLKHTKTPVVIVECGFLSNRTEAEKLNTQVYQQDVAEAICKGILSYMQK